ncbi:centriolin isoform X2 [Spea bombifrons]|uniref:centriolin isoform X2 n=1 Tax=Spea bombifrons TaxID=233779 RepID=UPI00234A7FDB|nr:centriolin isoform X2 [Spea bombifrons]
MKKGSQPRANKGPSPSSSSPTMKSPSSSSSNKAKAAPSYAARGPKDRRLDVTEESDVPDHDGDKNNESGVRYITEPLIQKQTKQENLAFVTSLNLSLSKEGGKKFKFIENLGKCERLEILNLGYNLIEKIEKLEKQTRLRELNLSHNKISKIEGLEHMQHLQKLNLAGNDIEHIPVWVGKKLRSLSILNLKQNKIFSLQDVSRLKPLKDLASLFLADNPISNLPHYRLYTIFHLRALDSLDGQPVTNQERQEAHDRFNIEEVEKLESELEKKMHEIQELQSQKAKVVDELQSQGETNKSLKQQAVQQKKNYKELEREVETKNEILKQKTLELTRACQKQYELEQELAFYKIDAKFEPMGYTSPENVEAEDAPGESPYIGKARYKRNLYAQEGFIADHAQQLQTGKMELDGDDQIRNEQIRARIHTTLDVDLDDKEKNISAAQTRLTELRQQIMNAEEQILKATEELKNLEEAIAQKKISEAEKEKLRQQLGSKIQLLNQLRQEAQELENQMERQRREMDKKHKEIDDLQKYLDSLNPQDPRHTHVKAQKAGKEQQLDMMTRQYQELEARLDEMLSRITKETEEIKDLEQQLTEGQIAANEALKRDLEGIIAGLQEYLESVKGQAKQAQEECRELQSEREELLQRLSELEEEKKQLEIVATDAENLRKEISQLERSLQEQQELNATLRQAQGDLSEYEAELEAQLKVRDAEANQLKEELERVKRLSHMESSALQAELEKDRQALENVLTKAQLLDEKEKENKKLLSQLKQTKGDNEFLKEQLENLQAQLDDALDNLVHPEQIRASVHDLKRKLQTGVGEVRSTSPSDVLGQSLADLQKQINGVLAKAQEEKKEALERQKKLEEEISSLQEKARDAPADFKRACNMAAEAKMQTERRQYEAKLRQLENEIRRLNGKLKNMEDIQGLADQQLVEADEERKKLLAELQELEEKRRAEDAQAQKQMSDLEKELRQLKRAVAASDKMATSELSHAKDQLKSLHGAVLKINQERTEEMQEAGNFCSQAAQASRDLAKAEAEIDLLQNLLKEREKQLQDEMQSADAGAATSNLQQLEIDKLNQTLKRQKEEIERLKHLLDHARADNVGEIEELLDEIDSLRHALDYQNDYITSMADPFRRRGYWCYMPSPSNTSGPDSTSTKDSGVGLQYPMTSSPARRTCSPMRYPKKEGAAGHWVYTPLRQGLHRWRTGRGDGDDGETQSDCSVPGHFVPPPGSVIYTVFPDGAPAPQGTVIYAPPPPGGSRPVAPGTVIYGPPPVGTQVVYGPPPAHFAVPVIPAGVLHCNVPTHHNLENEITRLEDIVDHLKSRRHKEKKAKERLLADIDDLERQKEILWKETEELRLSSQKRKRKDFVEGHLDSLITELKLEQSLQHHDDIADEIECIEKTLSKRRAELREADRLLAEAETELKNTRTKTSDIIEKYNSARKHLSHTESDAEELERRAQDTATQLVKANQQLRMLQASTQDLERHRAEQENVLKDINAVVSAKDAEFQSLSSKIQTMADNLQKLQTDLEMAEGKEDHHLNTLKEAQIILQEKVVTLEHVNSQVSAQQQEIVDLDRLLGQKEEELHLLQDQIDQKKASLKEVLRDGEMDVSQRRQEIKEVRSLLEDLSAQKGELNAQLNERRAQLAVLKQEVAEEEDTLQKVASQIHKHKSELKHVLEMIQFESNELEGLRFQHNQKVNEMEKTQCAVLEGKMELENLQRTCQRLRGDTDWQKQVMEKDSREMELLRSQTLSLQQNIEILSREKEQLERSRQDLEKKLDQAKKDLLASEDGNRAAASNLEKLRAEIKNLQKDIEQLNKRKQCLKEEAAAAQQLLQEKTEELNLLKDELTDSKEQLKVVEQDLRNSTKNRDDLLREQARLQKETEESMGRFKLLQEKETRKEGHLKQMQRAIEQKEDEVAKQERILKQIMKEMEHQEEHLKASAAKLRDHKQTMEWELANRQNALELVTSKVKELEERALKLQQEEKWSLALQEALRLQLSQTEQQLEEKNSEILALQKHLEIYKSDLSRLQDQMTSQKDKDEKRISVLKETINGQRIQYEDTIQELKEAKSSLWKRLTTVEQAAYDNHDRARHLLKELKQLQAEYAVLQKQLKSQEELDQRQQDVNEAVRALKAQVKMEIQSSLTGFCRPDEQELAEDVDGVLEDNESLRAQLESLKENFPFTANEALKPSLRGKISLTKPSIMDEHWRGEALREELRQQEDRLKAQLHQRMSKQADVLSQGRQQTEGSLISLKKQVDALDELVSNGSTDSPFHSHNSSGAAAAFHDYAPNPPSQRYLQGTRITGSSGILSQQLYAMYSPGTQP